MIRFLFWNVCGVASPQERKADGVRPLLPNDKRYRNVRRVLTVFCLREKIDVLVLAESPFEGQLDLPDFTEAKTSLLPNAKTKCRLEVYHRNTVFVTSTETLERAVIHGMTTASGSRLLLVSAHLESPLQPSREENRKENVRRFVADIGRKEEKEHLWHTVVVGDLNFDPYNTALTDAHYFNASPTKKVAEQKVRSLQHKETVPYFYNPMWAHLTDRTIGPPGTYYHKMNTVDCRFWYLPDQVLVRPALLDFWDDESLQILSHIGKISLLNKKGVAKDTPNRKRFSDHLPITFGVDF